MLEWFKSMDQFGKPFNFNLAGSDSYKTVPGSILTFLVSMATIYFFYYYGVDRIYYLNPNSDLTYILEDTDPIVNLTSTNFFYAVRIEDFNLNPITDPRYFEFFLEDRHYVYNTTTLKLEDINNRTISLTKCNKSNFPKDANFKDISLMKIEDWLCVDKRDLSVGGNWNTEMYTAEVRIKPCSNNTEIKYNITCADADEMNQLMIDNNNFLLVSELINKPMVNPSNYTHPMLDYYEFNFYQFKLNNKIWKEHRFIQSYLETDESLFFAEVTDTRESLEYDIGKFDRFLKMPSEDYFSTMFFISRVKKNYSRSYISVPDIISDAGGLMSVFLSVILWIYSFYLDSSYERFMIKSMFNLYLEQEAEDPSTKRQEIIKVNAPNCYTFDKDHDHEFRSYPSRQGIIKPKEQNIEIELNALSSSKEQEPQPQQEHPERYFFNNLFI